MSKNKKKINYDKVISARFTLFLVVMLFLFCIVLIKVFKVMIIDKKTYTEDLSILTYSTVSGTSSPRGRIYDRNYNILVDNKSLKTITYRKQKGITNLEMIKVASELVPHIDLNYQKLTDRAKREYYFAKNKSLCDKLVTKGEKEKVKQMKMTQNELDELKISRIKDKDLNFSPEEQKVAYLYYLMNKGYTYEEKIIKSNVSDKEYAYVSENNEELTGFNTKIDWERVYPYGDVFKTILGKVSTSTQGIPAEDKDYYLAKGYNLNDRVGISYLEKQYEEYLHGEKDVYEIVNSHETKLLKEGSRGKDIVLSIDINLQQQVERILEEQIRRAKGEANTEYFDHSSVVIEDPKTGEILAMASKRIVGDRVIDNTTSILMSPITPGSVVKGASMLVGYNEGAVRIGEVMLDECVKVAGVAEKCSSVDNLGRINDITALAKSSNVYQFKIAIRVNGQEYFRGMKMNFNQEAFDKYRAMYHSFGLGVKTEIDLPTESHGYSSTDKAAGNLLDFVMGQYETYTPMQLSQYITTIANGGERLTYFHIGPKFGTVSKQAVTMALREFRSKNQTEGASWLVILGFSFEDNINEKDYNLGTYQVSKVRMHDDLMQDGLLKKDRGAGSFITIGEPDIELLREGDNCHIEIRGLDIYDPIRDDVKARSVEDIAYWEMDDDYDGEQFICRSLHFCGGDKKEFEQWKKGLNQLASLSTKKKAERTLHIEFADELWDTLYTFHSEPIPYRQGRQIAVRVVSQFGEESTKVLTMK